MTNLYIDDDESSTWSKRSLLETPRLGLRKKREYYDHPFTPSYNTKVITIYNTTPYSSCDHTLSEGNLCLQGCFYLIRRKIRSTGVLLSSFSTKTCPWTELLRSYENWLSLSKAPVLVLAKPHLAHKSCRPGDEDRLVFVKSCNRTQTWRLFHLVASSVHIRSVWLFFPHFVALAATGETLDPVAEEATVGGGGHTELQPAAKSSFFFVLC